MFHMWMLINKFLNELGKIIPYRKWNEEREREIQTKKKIQYAEFVYPIYNGPRKRKRKKKNHEINSSFGGSI